MSERIELRELAARESEQVEWKESVADPDDVVRTVVAFANDLSNLGGGYVVCGAREVKDEHGFQRLEAVGLPASTMKAIEGRVIDSCARFVDPPIAPRVEELPSSRAEHRILVSVVPATGHAHSFRTKADTGKYFVRISRETREARNGLLRELLVRKGAREPWDRRHHPEATLADIDLVAFRDLLEQAGVWDPGRSVDDYLDPAKPISPFVPPFTAREALTGTIRPRNFTILLAGRRVQRFFPEAHAIFSMYPGPDRSEPYSERVEVDGTLVAQAIRLIERLNTESYAVMDKASGAVPNVVKYPRRALHEAVVNALAHRDYEAAHPVRVTALADRVEVFSPGGLPTAIDPETFRAGRAMPVWRNQALAWFLNKLQLAQAEGQGITTILRTMRAEGCPDPVFEVTPESLLCVLPAHPRHALMRDLVDAERLVALGRLPDALAKVEALLEPDPFNFRVIQLFCDIASSMGEPERVQRFVEKQRDRLDRFPATAQVMMADVLSSSADAGDAAKELARQLLFGAAVGHLEEMESRRLIVGLLRLRENDEALEVLSRGFRTHPGWSESPVFLQLRGRTLLQFAKACRDTARNRELAQRLRSGAWDRCRSYLQDAKRDLRAALDHAPDPVTRSHIESDLDFVEHLKDVARRPARR